MSIVNYVNHVHFPSWSSMYVSIGNICLFCCIADSWRKLFRLNDGGFFCFCAQVQRMHFSRRTKHVSLTQAEVTDPCQFIVVWQIEVALKLHRKGHWMIVSDPPQAVVWRLRFHAAHVSLTLMDVEMLCSLPALVSDCSFWLFCLRLNATWHRCSALLSRLCINHRFRPRIR